MKEKDDLLKRINNKEMNNFLSEINYKNKYENLKNIVNKIEKEKEILQNNQDKNNANYKNEIIRLKREINKCFINDKKILKNMLKLKIDVKI